MEIKNYYNQNLIFLNYLHHHFLFVIRNDMKPHYLINSFYSPRQDISNLSTSYQKDLITSFVESKVLSVGGVQNCYYGGMNEHWYSHLEYYYKKPDNERLKLLKQTERFNIYATDSEIPYLNDIGNFTEHAYS